MRLLPTIALVLVSGSCARSPRSTSQSPAACLQYPTAGVRPAFADSLYDENGWICGIEVSADGKRVAFTDLYGRLVGWDLSGTAEPILYAGGGGLVGITRYGGAYSTNATGQLMRTDLQSGRRVMSWEQLLLPTEVTSLHLDASGRYLAVSSRGAPSRRDIIVIDDCVFQEHVARDCDIERWHRSVHSDSQVVLEAFVDGDTIVGMERPTTEPATEVVVRRLSTGEKLRSWDPGDDNELLVIGGYAIGSNAKSGKLHIRAVADGKLTGEVMLGEAYASHEPGCYQIEGGRGTLVMLRRSPDCGLGQSGWRWAVVDVAARRIVWQTTERVGGVGLGPGRRIYTATTRGVCSAQIGG
jgi:hypothetical protein